MNSAVSRASSIPVWLLGGLIGVLIFGSMLRESSGDPFIVAALADDSALLEYVEEEAGREVWIRSSTGHDGKFMLVQAVDPFLRSGWTIDQLQPPRYRAQRVLYPLVVGGGGAAPTTWIPWLMGLTQIACFALGTHAASHLAIRRGLSRWWGLAFPLNPGVVAAFLVGGATGVSLALALVGLDQLERRRVSRAGLAFAASLLTREIMVLLVAGACVSELIRNRRIPWRLGLVSVLPSFGWMLYVRSQIPQTGSTNGGVVAPFSGLEAVWPFWTTNPAFAAFGGLTLMAIAVVLGTSVQQPDPLMIGAAAFGVLFFFLSPAVVHYHFDYSRAIVPVYVAFMFVVGSRFSGSERSTSPMR